MESRVIFRDYQEQQAQDHNDLQIFAERSFDHLVLDAVTSERRYAGFTCVKTGQVEVQISPGRMYDALGAIYAVNSTTTQSMVSISPLLIAVTYCCLQLALISKRTSKSATTSSM